MIQELNLKGKVAVVTGAKQGIGLAIAVRLAQCGADVAVMDISLDQSDEVCKQVEAQGVKCVAISCDVSDEAAVAKAFGEVNNAFGRLDILANNAGITRDAMSKKMTPEDFRKVLDVNLVGSFLCSQQAFTLMKETGGCIVNFSSVSAVKGNIGQSNYSASKAGLLGLTKTLALEGARNNIRVNAVAPGFIETPMTEVIPDKLKEAAIAQIPLARIGTPMDVANSVLFLVSDMSSYITGECIHINGGRYMI